MVGLGVPGYYNLQTNWYFLAPQSSMAPAHSLVEVPGWVWCPFSWPPSSEVSSRWEPTIYRVWSLWAGVVWWLEIGKVCSIDLPIFPTSLISARNPAILVKTCHLPAIFPTKNRVSPKTTLPPMVMVQWKMGVSPIEVTFFIQPFSTSNIMGERMVFW